MQTIVIVDNQKAAVAFHTAHTEQVHRFVIHAEQKADAGSLIRLQERTSLGQKRSETSIQHIEITTFSIILHIGIKPQEARKAHQEHQVKIGERTLLALVQPTDGVHQIGKQGFVGSFFLQGTVKEFGQKHRNGRLIRMVRQRTERIKRLRLADAVQVARGAHIGLQLHYRQGLEEYAPHAALPGAGYLHQERSSSALLGVDVHNVRSIVVLQRMEHNACQFLIHYLYIYAFMRVQK